MLNIVFYKNGVLVPLNSVKKGSTCFGCNKAGIIKDTGELVCGASKEYKKCEKVLHRARKYEDLLYEALEKAQGGAK